MHLSTKFHPHQLKMPKDKIPDENLRKELFSLASNLLEDNHYARAGYDHFVSKDDKLYDELKADYEQLGFNDNSEELLKNYKAAFNLFESEFEI